MAVIKAVNTERLDADLTSVADAIRQKTGQSGQLAFPGGFVSAVGSITVGGGMPSNITYIGEYTANEEDGTYGGFYIPVTGYNVLNKWLLLIPKQMGGTASRICRGMIVRWSYDIYYTIQYIYAAQSGGVTMTGMNKQEQDGINIHIIGGNMYRLKRGSGETTDHITYRCYGIG